jgi:hypothetical protein
MKEFLQVQQRPKMIQKLFIDSRIKQMTQIFFLGGPDDTIARFILTLADMGCRDQIPTQGTKRARAKGRWFISQKLPK